MSARDLWRRLCAAVGGRWHIPDEADMLRLAQLVGERTSERDSALAVLTDVIAERDKATTAVRELTDALGQQIARAVEAERERDQWRLRARHQPDDDEAARHAEVELRGGR